MQNIISSNPLVGWMDGTENNTGHGLLEPELLQSATPLLLPLSIASTLAIIIPHPPPAVSLKAGQAVFFRD